MNPWAIAALSFTAYTGGWTVCTRQYIRNRWRPWPSWDWSIWPAICYTAWGRAGQALLWPVQLLTWVFFAMAAIVLHGVAGDLDSTPLKQLRRRH